MNSSRLRSRFGPFFLAPALAFALHACGGDEGSDFCRPPSGYVPAQGLPPCTSANEGDYVCTYVGPGYECTEGCWAEFSDGPCWPEPDAGTDASAGSGP